ncbi:MAG: cell envelope integrity protein TolA [Chlorobi bacterium]|nr:cell envelope integrity protein TolA [Chlorobiota bacterium]
MERSQELRIERKRFSFWLAVTSGAHLLVMLLVMALQLLFGRGEPAPKIVNVSLVSLPGPGGSALQAPEGEPGTDASAKDAAAAEEEPEREVSAVEPEPVSVSPKKTVPDAAKQKIPEKPVVKSSPAEKIPDRQAQLGKALDKLKASVNRNSAGQGPQRENNLGSALARLQQKVASQGAGASGRESGGGGSSAGSSTGRGGGGTADPYKVKIASIIQKNWEFSSHMLQNSYGMEVYVHIFILPDGTIREITYDKRAPSAYLNNSVKKALEKSSPLPQLPQDYGSGGTSIGFVFTPEGIDM